MDTLPLAFKVAQSPVLVVGAGDVACRKIELLLKAGAHVTVVAPHACDKVLAWRDSGKLQLLTRSYSSSDVTDACIVVAATADSAVNAQVSVDAQAENTPVNVVDAPQLCTVLFPAVVDRGALHIAISSGGRSPVLTRIVRRKIEALIPARYSQLVEFAGRFRDRVKEALSSARTRRLFWEDVLEGRIGELVLSGNESEAIIALEDSLASPQANDKGAVYLVGAGPGDPDLLTFKAARALQRADVVLYDALVSQPIVDMTRRDAQKIYVGKRRADHALPQTEINQLLLELAQQGQCVVRLKGGDPFIFGRGGEEIELLAAHGIPFQVIPGISAANGVACYAGIPLTHRDHAQSVRFVTGHRKDGTINHDWSQFQSPSETLVFYMGLIGLPQICEQLCAHGRDPETPVALIERGTTVDQRVFVGTLQTMPDIVERESPTAPTLLIVGDVVTLHGELAWYNH